VDLRDTAQISGKDEKTNEGKKQAVIDFFEKLTIQQQEDEQNDTAQQAIVQDAEHGQKTEQKQTQVNPQPPGTGRAGIGSNLHMDFFFAHEKATGDKDNKTENCRRENRTKKFSGRKLITAKEEEILRIAHRGGHAAEVGGNGLQDDDPYGMRTFLKKLQHQKGKGDKGDECHVVGDQHGGKEGEKHKRQSNSGHAAAASEKNPRQSVKNAAGFKPQYSSHETEKQAQYPKIDITNVGRIRRDKEHGNDSTECGNAQHGFLFNKALDFLHGFAFLNALLNNFKIIPESLLVSKMQ